MIFLGNKRWIQQGLMRNKSLSLPYRMKVPIKCAKLSYIFKSDWEWNLFYNIKYREATEESRMRGSGQIAAKSAHDYWNEVKKLQCATTPDRIDRLILTSTSFEKLIFLIIYPHRFYNFLFMFKILNIFEQKSN